jgi:hypothetical protein
MTSDTITASRPDVVGCFADAGKTVFFPARYDELERQSIAIARLLRSFSFSPGSVILTISLVQEIVQFAPFEKAIQILGHYGINAEATNYDAGRIESVVRQFDTPAICGIGAAALEGLAMFGHDPAKVFAGRTVWARPDAYATVSKMPGVNARRLVILGPAIALECAAGGLHYDDRDWTLDSRNGRLFLSSRLPRITPVTDVDTGIDGSKAILPCSCGTKEGCLAL